LKPSVRSAGLLNPAIGEGGHVQEPLHLSKVWLDIQQDPHGSAAVPARGAGRRSLFQRREASAVERLYAYDYIQHNPNIPQGREALQSLVENLSPSVHYEPGLIISEGDLVAIHGRIRGWADEPQVVVNIFRIEGGKLAEHWDVLQNEVPITGGVAGLSMFDPQEGASRVG
jgi:predicted SnoaL-like aldol condensation-catalyzing enzyme